MIWKYQKYVGDTKFYELFDSKKIFGARALPRAARAEFHIAGKTQKSWFFGIGGRIFWARARQKFFRIEKFMKFCISYILLIFLYHVNSWF